jgi:nitroreductase
MNPVLEAIKKRRSVRSYESKPIPRDIINTIIQAGNEAPSPMNSQPWRFVVVESKKVQQQFLRVAMKPFDQLEDTIYYSAPVVLFVIGIGTYAEYACSMVCQNIMLAAYSLGLGSCCVGSALIIKDDAEVRKILELKDNEKIFGPIILGYPKVYPDPPLKKYPIVKWV